ncbi:hypothetical protein [Tsuneonella sp. HG222]
MTNSYKGLAPNRVPTDQEIAHETLYLDAHGMTVSNLLRDNPVDLTTHISKQTVLNPLIDLMADDGWAFMGSGFFAAVFVKGGLALKIGFKVNDTGGMYAAWCRAHQGTPGVPTVYSITKFTGCYVVLTRRYDAIDKAWLNEDDVNCVPSLAEEFDALSDALNRGKNWGIARFDTVKTAIAIRDFFQGIADFDLHESNVMLDHAGDIMITDPISHGPCYTGGGSYYSATGYTPA